MSLWHAGSDWWDLTTIDFLKASFLKRAGRSSPGPREDLIVGDSFEGARGFGTAQIEKGALSGLFMAVGRLSQPVFASAAKAQAAQSWPGQSDCHTR